MSVWLTAAFKKKERVVRPSFYNNTASRRASCPGFSEGGSKELKFLTKGSEAWKAMSSRLNGHHAAGPLATDDPLSHLQSKIETFERPGIAPTEDAGKHVTVDPEARLLKLRPTAKPVDITPREPPSEFRQQIEFIFLRSSIAHCFDIIQALLSIGACILFVVSTYLTSADDRQLPMWVESCEWFLFICFAVDFGLRLYLAHHRCQYLTSESAMIDMLAVLPVIVLFFPDAQIGFIRLLRGSRVFRVLRLKKVIEGGAEDAGEALQQQLTLLAFTVLAFLFVATGLIYTLSDALQAEQFVDPVGLLGSIAFYDAFYFVVVSISTVGYGEITPIHWPGMLLTMVIIILLLVIVPKECGRIAALLDKTSNYDGRFTPTTEYDHVVLFGDPPLSALTTFLQEFYHPDHGNVITRVVFLNPEEPSPELIELLEVHEMVQYVKGSPMVAQELFKACISEAKAVFMMCNASARDQYVNDLDVLLAFNSVVSHSALDAENEQADPPIFMQLLTHRATDVAAPASDTRIVCNETARLGILAMSIHCPGFSTLLSNLVQSSGEPESLSKRWLKEYCFGFGQEIYSVALPAPFVRCKFQELSIVAYTQYGICIFAVSPAGGGVLINPYDYVLIGDEECYLIADDEDEAVAFSKYKNTKRSSLCSSIDTSNQQLLTRLPKARNIPTAASGCSTLVGHIILVGILPQDSLGAFLGPLRQLSSQQVVYLHDAVPSNADALALEQTEGAYFVQV